MIGLQRLPELIYVNYNYYNSETSCKNMEWCEVSSQSFHVWDQKLESAACSYRQFPFWAEAYKTDGYRPRFFFYGDRRQPLAFVAIIEVGIGPLRAGLIDRGPVLFVTEECDIAACLCSLKNLVKELGYVFLRFTQSREDIFLRITEQKGIEMIEPYPFCRDSQNSLLIKQKPDEAEMISGFSETARQSIKRALRFSYDIRISDSDSDFDHAWELFEKLAFKKGFRLSARPKAFWREMLRLGAPNNLARLYLCSHEGKLIAAQLHVRDGEVCEAMLAALDLEALGNRPSPSAYLYWIAMRYGHEFGCSYYNIGGPGDPKRNNHLYEFKRKFKPELQIAPQPACLVIRPTLYWIWMKVILRGWRAWRNRFGDHRRKSSGRNIKHENEKSNSIGGESLQEKA